MLQQYTEKPTTKLLESMGAFFAYSNDQFDQQRVEGVEYVSMGMGLVAPKANVAELRAGLEQIHLAAVKKVKAEHKKEDIIAYELSNHESYYTGDIKSAFDALSIYGYTVAEVREVFNARRGLNHD